MHIYSKKALQITFHLKGTQIYWLDLGVLFFCKLSAVDIKTKFG